MDITGIGSVLDFGGKIIDRLWPDPEQRDAAKLELFKAQQAGEFKAMDQAFELAQSQIEVNKVEAASSSLFVAGWRPMAGWVCAVTLALTYIPKALILATMWAIQAYSVIQGGGVLPAYPDVGLTDVLGLLAALLGIGSLRTTEKIKGVAR